MDSKKAWKVVQMDSPETLEDELNNLHDEGYAVTERWIVDGKGKGIVLIARHIYAYTHQMATIQKRAQSDVKSAPEPTKPIDWKATRRKKI